MKKILFAAILLSSIYVKAQNSLLNADFWKKSPTVLLVQQEIEKGNSPSEANRGNHDVVSIAINNDAPIETILFLLDQSGNSVKKTTHDGRLYLHWAASKGNDKLVKILLDKGSDINRTDDKGAIPISFAASNGQTNTLVYELLFEAGNDPKQKYQNGANLLLLSIAYDKDLKLAEYLATKGLSLFDKDDFGNTAFDYATRTGDIQFLKKLLEKGVKPTEKALLFAAQGTRNTSNKLELYQFLIDELKINPNAKGDNGENVLHTLVKKQNQTEIINYFITKGVDVNHVDKEGNTVFMEASKSSNVDVLKQLISLTKDINQKNKKGLTALSNAVVSGSSEVLEFILSKKPNVNINDNDGNNLAYYLVQSYRSLREGQKDVFSEKLTQLKKAGINFNALQKDNNTLYHIAVTKNDIGLLKKLSDLNIDINALNTEGISVLHKAALTAKDDEILKFLIAKGADKTLKTEFDETAYDLASENESLKENNINLDFLK